MTQVVILTQPRLRREAWRALLGAQPGIKVLSALAEPEGLSGLPQQEDGTSVLADAEEPVIETLHATARLRPKWGILVLVRSYGRMEIAGLLRAGALGVLSRESEVTELVSGLVAVARGEIVLPGSLAGEVLADLLGDSTVEPTAPSTPSPREIEVLQWLARGMTNKAIAQEMLLSVRTVEGHLRAIFGKIGVSSRTEAVLWALRHGYARTG